MYFSLKMLTFLSLKVLIRINYRVGGCNSNEFLNDILCNINLHVFWAIFLSIKSWKPQPQRMVCTCTKYNEKWYTSDKGLKKAEFCSLQVNHKIYFSMRSQTLFFLGDQLQLHLFHQYCPPTNTNHSTRLEIVSLLRLDYKLIGVASV